MMLQYTVARPRKAKTLDQVQKITDERNKLNDER